MKTITPHPVSVLVGVVLAGVLVVLAGAAQAPGTAQPVPTQFRLVGEIPAEWWTFVELKTTDGVPVQTFVVPAQHYFVATLVDNPYWVNANGQPATRTLEGLYAGAINAAGAARVPFGPGTLLEMTYPNPGTVTTRLWGYLEPVR